MRKRVPGYGVFELHKALKARGDHAATTAELREITKLPERTFLNAMYWLERQGEIFRWKGEGFQFYVVLTEHARTAWYDVKVSLPGICTFFGQGSEVTVRRTVPFVVSEDEDSGAIKRNRYREIVA